MLSWKPLLKSARPFGCQSHDVVVPDFVCFCFQKTWNKSKDLGFYVKLVKVGETLKALVTHYAVGS